MRYVFLLLMLTALTGRARAQDAAARRLAATVAQALGAERLAAVPYLRFDFVFTLDDFTFTSRHLWDRQRGRSRVEWTFGGRRFVAIFDTATRAGRVWVNGTELPPDEARRLIDRNPGGALYRFLNETYWLLMPFKLLDPGTRLTYLGRQNVDDRPYEVLHLAFDHVGLTPGDQYWLYVNPETGHPERFAYYLERFGGTPALDGASVWDWTGWKTVDGVRLAQERVLRRGPHEGRKGRVHFPLLRTLDGVDEAVFDGPETPLPEGH